MKILWQASSRFFNRFISGANIKSSGLPAAVRWSAVCLLLAVPATAMSQNKTGGPEISGPASNIAQAGSSTISGTIATTLPDGSVVSVFVSTDYFRNGSFSAFPFTVKGGSLSYNLPLPAPAIYYIGAVGGELINRQHPAFGAPIGVFNDYAPVALRPGAAVADADFAIAADTVAPSLSISYPSEGSVLTTLYQILGTASDNLGVVAIEAAVQDLTTGLWRDGDSGLWVYGSTPLYHDAYAALSGPPRTPGWTVNSGGPAAWSLSAITGQFVKEHIYRFYFRATDFSSNVQSPPVSVSFTWMAQPDSGPASQVIGVSSATSLR